MIRIVKMHFKIAHTEDFIQLFEERKEKIRNFPGCQSVTMLQQIDLPQVFFTYSYWENESDLENYRQSELFADTWATVKQWFDQKAQAWSVNALYEL
jgi:heme-degrading monooxygenase HmoA